MKVLIYSKLFMPNPGGTQTIVLELARGLSEWPLKHREDGRVNVTVVTQTLGPWEEDASLPFNLIRCPDLRRFIRLLRETDIVHLAGPAMLPLAFGLLFRKPIVIEHHGFQVACPNGLLFYEPTQSPCPGHFMAKRYDKCLECNNATMGRLKSFGQLVLTSIRRWLSGRADMNILPTEWLGTVLKLRRMSRVHHGISPVSSLASAEPSPSTFGFQGRLVSTKGINLLLRAAAQLRHEGYNFRIKIVGDGPELNRLKLMAAESGVDIEFLGHIPENRLQESLSDVSTIVMPSLGGEVFGLVASENMQRGKLLIVSDLGALREVVGDAGLIFRTGDADDLASCMRRVLDNPTLTRSLGSAARSRIEHVFRRDRMIQEHIRIYEAALLR
jgi:glycosyltransferase involved in cell wall biosynthesis